MLDQRDGARSEGPRFVARPFDDLAAGPGRLEPDLEMPPADQRRGERLEGPRRRGVWRRADGPGDRDGIEPAAEVLHPAVTVGALLSRPEPVTA